MKRVTFPRPFRPAPPPFRLAGRVLLGPVPANFEAFYRAELRFRHGGRVRSIEVARRYGAWAAHHEAGHITLPQLRRIMWNIGHPHFHSNNTYFGDAQFVEVDPDLVDNFPGLAAEPAAPGDAVILRLDRVAAELQQVRAMVAGMAESHHD